MVAFAASSGRSITRSVNGYLPTLTWQLVRARLAIREGAGILSAASVFAYTICATLALTVAGGTWLFYNRWRHPHGVLLDVLVIDPTYARLLNGYFVLALVACALLVPTMVGLAAGAAVLGARSRERRLSALRLIGLSAGDVSKMSLLDNLLQSVAGTLLGLICYLVSLPAWQLLEMQAMPLASSEMLLPWWGLAGVPLGTVLIGLVAGWWGLRMVRITPLGVARRTPPPGLRWWRLLVFAVALVAAGILVSRLELLSMAAFYVLAGIMLGCVVAVQLFAPWLLQVVSVGFARLSGPTVIWAARRIQANAKQTWQRVYGIGLLGMIGGFIAVMPIHLTQDPDRDKLMRDVVAASQWDFTKGAIIALAVGFVITATAILISQASAVFERAEQSQALARMGTPTSYLTKVMWLETLGPLIAAVGLGTMLGLMTAQPMVRLAAGFGFGTEPAARLTVIIGVLVAGILLAIVALLVCGRLQHQVLAQIRRRND